MRIEERLACNKNLMEEHPEKHVGPTIHLLVRNSKVRGAHTDEFCSREACHSPPPPPVRS